ncbi:MAG TPA: DNA polymerase I [Accumulibacter sp.]|uniref:DNA polymerase I n=1 Tax=Accumulibacter sp. TaxID=2053492 RepID=UPI002C9F776A|nr:DNA polymerase I [Accumulibacter sp.]HRD88785.1 DNA polymerase I [Accumulibacter sp.]
MSLLFCDLETFSDVPIAHGTHKYAARAEVLLWSWAIDDGPVHCWDVTETPVAPSELRVALHSPEVMTVWHNGGNFDRVVLGHALPALCPPIERIHDTMVMALTHGLPGALDTLGNLLGIPQEQRKDKRGRDLINLFCKPRPASSALRRATRMTHPTQWAEFIAYAEADVLAMRAIYRKLPSWNYRDRELALWHLDQQINARGVAVDLDLVQAAIRATTRAQTRLAVQTQDLTQGAVQAATQRDKLLAHILAEYGIGLPDLQASTLERRIEDPDVPSALRELLAIRLQASKSSAAKYLRVLQGASSDGRLRGLLQFCGASRTGRWAGRLFQPHNLPRPAHPQKVIDLGIEAMKADAEDLIFDDVMMLSSSAIRSVIVAPEGRKLVVADLANIEGRMLAWLADEEWKLQAFRDFDTITGWTTNKQGEPEAIRKGPDLYALAYAKSFGITADEVMDNKENGDGSMRQVGKVQELALGFAGGVGAFITFSLVYHIDLDAMAEAAIGRISHDTQREALEAWAWAEKKGRTFGLAQRTYVVCDAFKRLWREAHPHVVNFWAAIEDCARRAILLPGVTFPCGKLKLRRDGAWLRIALPSGRCLRYPSPQVDAQGKISYMGVHQYTRKWQRLKTYGGKLTENVTQAASRDVLADSMPAIEGAGYEIVLTVHDEILSEAPDTPEFNADHLAGLMATAPSWATGLPLAAAGFESYRYRKN